jgi:hypothetical protein
MTLNMAMHWWTINLNQLINCNQKKIVLNSIDRCASSWNVAQTTYKITTSQFAANSYRPVRYKFI